MRARTSLNLSAPIACALALGLGMLSTTAHAASPYFTSVRAQIDEEVCDVSGNCVNVISASYGEILAETGSSPDLYAKGRTGYGDNGAYAIASDQPTNLGAYAESIWVDAFNITGGTGSANLTISVMVNGTLQGTGANSFYQLYASDSPISCDFDNVSCAGTLVIPLTENISGSLVFSAQVPFTYGQTFYIASYLGAEVLGDGVSDFYGSAHFGATAPDGSAIVGLSGTTYALVAQVPEAETYAMMLAGLGLVGFMARRRKQSEA